MTLTREGADWDGGVGHPSGSALDTSSGLAAKRNILAALIKAEITVQFGKTGIGFFGHVAEPLFDLGVLVAWHHAVREIPVYGPSVILFIASGILPIFIFIRLSSLFNSVVKTSSQAFRGIEMIDVMIAKTVIALVVYGIVGTLLFAGIYTWDSPYAAPRSPLYVLEAAMLLSMLGLGVAFLNAIIGQLIPLWHYIWGGISRSFILFGGALYVPDMLPPFLRDFIRWNPVAQGVSIFRQGFYPNYPHFIFEPLFLPCVAVGTLVFGVIAQHQTRHMVRRYRLFDV